MIPTRIFTLGIIKNSQSKDFLNTYIITKFWVKVRTMNSLQSAIDNENLETVRNRLSANPRLILSRINDLTPLLYALNRKDLEIARVLIPFHPEALLIPDQNGSLPLHWVAQLGAKDDLEFILNQIETTFGKQRVEEQLMTSNAWNRVPMWYACGFNSCRNVQGIMFERCPAAAQVIPKEIVDPGDGSAKIVSEFGPSILRMLLRPGRVNLELIQMILDRYGWNWLEWKEIFEIQLTAVTSNTSEIVTDIFDFAERMEVDWKQNHAQLIIGETGTSNVSLMKDLIQSGWKKYGPEWTGAIFGVEAFYLDIFNPDMIDCILSIGRDLLTLGIPLELKVAIRESVMDANLHLSRWIAKSDRDYLERYLRLLIEIISDPVVPNLDPMFLTNMMYLTMVNQGLSISTRISRMAFLIWFGGAPCLYPRFTEGSSIRQFLRNIGGINSELMDAGTEEEILGDRYITFFSRSLVEKLSYFI